MAEAVQHVGYAASEGASVTSPSAACRIPRRRAQSANSASRPGRPPVGKVEGEPRVLARLAQTAGIISATAGTAASGGVWHPDGLVVMDLDEWRWGAGDRSGGCGRVHSVCEAEGLR